MEGANDYDLQLSDSSLVKDFQAGRPVMRSDMSTNPLIDLFR